MVQLNTSKKDFRITSKQSNFLIYTSLLLTTDRLVIGVISLLKYGIVSFPACGK